jgi:hypothetical protein
MRILYVVLSVVRATSFTLLATGDPDFTLSAQAWSKANFSPWLLLHSEPRHSLFCMIPKNACSEFLALMMRAQGLNRENWNPQAKGNPQSFLHWDKSREVLFFKDGDSHVLEGILRNKTWIKAVFLRDPIERFVSAYLTKIKGKNISPETPSWAGTQTIGQFVAVLESEGLHDDIDPHFRLQSSLCGLSETLSQYDFIGFMNNLEEDADRMGSLMGIQDLLHDGWGPHQNQSLFGTPRSVRDGPLAMESGGHLRRAASHQESSQAGIFWMDGGSGAEFEGLRVEIARVRADPKLEARIRALYHEDYDLLSRARRQMASGARVSD